MNYRLNDFNKRRDIGPCFYSIFIKMSDTDTLLSETDSLMSETDSLVDFVDDRLQQLELLENDFAKFPREIHVFFDALEAYHLMLVGMALPVLFPKGSSDIDGLVWDKLCAQTKMLGLLHSHACNTKEYCSRLTEWFSESREELEYVIRQRDEDYFTQDGNLEVSFRMC